MIGDSKGEVRNTGVRSRIVWPVLLPIVSMAAGGSKLQSCGGKRKSDMLEEIKALLVDQARRAEKQAHEHARRAEERACRMEEHACGLSRQFEFTDACFAARVLWSPSQFMHFFWRDMYSFQCGRCQTIQNKSCITWVCSIGLWHDPLLCSMCSMFSGCKIFPVLCSDQGCS